MSQCHWKQSTLLSNFLAVPNYDNSLDLRLSLKSLQKTSILLISPWLLEHYINMVSWTLKLTGFFLKQLTRQGRCLLLREDGWEPPVECTDSWCRSCCSVPGSVSRHPRCRTCRTQLPVRRAWRVRRRCRRGLVSRQSARRNTCTDCRPDRAHTGRGSNCRSWTQLQRTPDLRPGAAQSRTRPTATHFRSRNSSLGGDENWIEFLFWHWAFFCPFYSECIVAQIRYCCWDQSQKRLNFSTPFLYCFEMLPFLLWSFARVPLGSPKCQ